MKLITFSLLLALSPLVSSASPAGADTISTSGSSNWSSDVNVPKETHWSAGSKLQANRLISLLESDLNRMLTFYKKQGASSVSSVNSKPVSTLLRKYGLRYQEVTYIAKTSSGKSLPRRYKYPMTQVSFANNLVSLNANDCSLREFNFWAIETWFQTECSVEKPNVKDFLRAQVATKFSLGPGNSQDVVNYELSKLRFVLENRVPFEITGDKLTFEKSANKFGTDNQVWLGSITGWFDFKISIDRAHWTATIVYFAPDARKLSETCGLDLRMRMLTF
jgi:hypothetical protein